MIADHLILGGGSAGCVLAARLSEDQNRTVVLVEAGRNIAAGDIPDAVRSRYPGRAYLDTRNIWASLTSLMGYSGSNSAPRTARRYEQAKILGGGSAINALMANRGAPSDYAEWQALGADGWSWEDCLPYFRKIETDRDFSGPLHGTDGPLTIRRITGEKISPFVDRVMQIGPGTTTGTDIGPMINDAAVAKIRAHVADALALGAENITPRETLPEGSRYVAPMVLKGATTAMRLASEETFGPVAPLFRFHDEAEAIAIANATPFGLAAYFFTENLHRSWRVGEALEFGMRRLPRKA